jgi:hypothetical protein
MNGDKDTILVAIHTDSIDRCKTNYPRSRTGSAPSMRSIQYQRKNINVLPSYNIVELLTDGASIYNYKNKLHNNFTLNISNNPTT